MKNSTAHNSCGSQQALDPQVDSEGIKLARQFNPSNISVRKTANLTGQNRSPSDKSNLDNGSKLLIKNYDEKVGNLTKIPLLEFVNYYSPSFRRAQINAEPLIIETQEVSSRAPLSHKRGQGSVAPVRRQLMRRLAQQHAMNATQRNTVRSNDFASSSRHLVVASDSVAQQDELMSNSQVTSDPSKFSVRKLQ